MRTILASLLLSSFLCAQAESRPATTSKRTPAQNGTLIVLNKNDATAWLIDAPSGVCKAQLEVGVGPHEAACSPDGKLAVVCNYGDQATIGSSLTLIDVARQEVRATLSLAPYRRPHGIQFSSDGKRVAITAEMDQKLLIVDLEKSTISATIPTNARISHMVVVDSAGARGYVTNIGAGSLSVLDLKTKEFVKEVKTDRGCEGVALRPGTPEVWTTNRAADTVSVVDTTKLEVVAKLECGKFPLRIAFLPDGKHALVACTESDEVVVIDAESRTVKKRISLAAGAKPAGILVAPDGSRAWVAQMAAGGLAELDLRDFTVVRQVVTGAVPDGMAWSVVSD